MKIERTDNIYAAFEQTALRRPEHSAVYFLGTGFTYAAVKSMAERLAAGLRSIGVRPGHKVVLYVPNSIQWIIAWLGTLRCGAVCVPITPIYTPRDLAYIANDSEADTVICADTNFGYVQSVLTETGIKRTVIVRIADLLPGWKRWFGYIFDVLPSGNVAYDDKTFSFRKLLQAGSSQIAGVTETAGNGRQLAEILYTGGTTKHPKGVPIPHDLFLISADEQIRISGPLFPSDDNVIMGNAPLFHILGQTCSLATLLTGGSLIVQPRLNLDATFESIQRFRARTMIGVPALYRMILEHDRLDQYDLSSVDYWFSAGDVLPTEVAQRWHKRFGKSIHQGYGATETCGGVAMCPVGKENPPRSVGQIVASKRAKIVDPLNLEPVAAGESGELLVSSDHMVTAYINQPRETEKAFLELEGRLWYRTADVMTMDNDGNLYFVDRTVDTIKHKGYRVSASEIESVLQEHPAVISTCVVGIPDESVGERIKAYVVLKSDIKGITGYDLIKWCRDQLVAYKVPQYIEFRDMLPKSKVGKLLRREIREEERRRKEA